LITAQNVIDAARRKLSDVLDGSAGQRWEDDDLLIYLNQAMQELASRRSDLLLAADMTLNELEEITDATDDLVFESLWREPLATLIAAYALEEDGSDQENAARTLALRAAFEKAIS